MSALAVLGAGAWGTALAAVLAPRHRVVLWARDAAQAKAIADARRNERYLPEIRLPDSLAVTSDWTFAVSEARLILVATPVAGLRSVLDMFTRPIPFAWLCKGFEQESGALPHEIAAAAGIRAPCGALSGPRSRSKSRAACPARSRSPLPTARSPLLLRRNCMAGACVSITPTI